MSTLAIAIFFRFLPSTFAEFGRTAYAAALFVSNFYFYQHSDYFAVSANYQPFIHTWSLSVEEQYYLVAPLALVLFCGFAQRRKLNRDSVGIILCLGAFILSCAAMVLLSYSGTHANAFAFYSPLTRIFQFAAGAFLFFAFNSIISNSIVLPPQRYLNLIPAAGIGLLGYAIFFLPSGAIIPGWHALLPTFGAAMVIFGAVQAPNSRAVKLLASSPIVFIGLISYGWYLWHWPILTLARMSMLDEPGLGRDLFAVAISMLLAVLTYLGVERPLRKLRHSPSPFLSSGRIVAAGIVASIAVVAISITFRSWSLHRYDQPEFSALRAAKQIPGTRYCDRFQPTSLLKGICLFFGKEGEQPPKILVWGDSHAESLARASKDLALANGITIALAARSACIPLLDLDLQRSNRGTDVSCRAYNRTIFDWIKTHHANGLHIILYAYWQNYLNAITLVPRWNMPERSENKRIFAAALDRTLRKIRALGVKVLLIGPTPAWSFPPPECLYERKTRGQNAARCGSPRVLIEQALNPAAGILRTGAARLSNTLYVDTLGFYCNDRICLPGTIKDILFRDRHHLSDVGSQHLFKSLNAPLHWLLDDSFIVSQ